jgi:hypothetical protein
MELICVSHNKYSTSHFACNIARNPGYGTLLKLTYAQDLVNYHGILSGNLMISASFRVSCIICGNSYNIGGREY